MKNLSVKTTLAKILNFIQTIGGRVVVEGSSSTSAVSNAAGATVTIGSISLTPGRWIVICRARFEPTASGNNYSAIYFTSDSTLTGWHDRRYSETTYQLQHSTVLAVAPTATTTYYLRGTCNNAGKWLRTSNSAYTIDATRIRGWF